MKKTYLFSLLVFFCCAQTLNAQPVTLDPAFEQKGKIIDMPNPCETEPCLPGILFGFETTIDNYVLTINFNWIWSDNQLIFENVEYFIGDEVEITGITTTKQDIFSNEYTELEIKNIKKLNSIIESESFSNIKIYYDVIKQVIVINETLQTQSLTFELVDMQGKVILRKTSIDNNDCINVANLLRGVYFYRLMQNGREINIGKLLINN